MTSTERSQRRRARLAVDKEIRRRERDQKRRTRAAERDQADAERPPAPPIPDSLAEYLAGLEVTQGEHEGELLTVLEWQREFLERVDGLPGGELGLSVGAGAGKTTLVAGIAAAGVAGPLARRRSAVLTVAGSFSQACLIFDSALAFLRPWIDADPDRWRVLRSEHTALIQDRETGAELRAREANARTLHGAAPVLVLADEPAQWMPSQADKLYSALRSRLGKIPGARLLAIGTRPATADHWFERLLRRSGITHKADADADPFDPATWAAANPSLAHFPTLMQTYEREAAEARTDSSLMPAFKALRLNQGVRDHEVALLLQPETWERIEALPDGHQAGAYCLGIDLGSTQAMGACSGWWYRSGLLRSLAAFAAEPDLEQRGHADNVADLYQRMHDRGELITTPGLVVQVADLLREVLDRWGLPSMICCDRYREAELRQALAAAKWPRIPLHVRGMGYKDGSEDVRRFRRACLSGDVKPEVSLLLRSAMAEAVTISDPAGNEKLAKGSQAGRRSRARDDAAAAAILSVSQGMAHRGKEKPAGVKLRVVA